MSKKNNLKILKPWGYEVIIEENKYYSVKKLFMKKGHRCSLQYHKKKIETITCLKGLLSINLNNKKLLLKENETITIKPKQVHRMSAEKNDCLYMESSSNHLTDVIRIEDDYSRIKKK